MTKIVKINKVTAPKVELTARFYLGLEHGLELFPESGVMRDLSTFSGDNKMVRAILLNTINSNKSKEIRTYCDYLWSTLQKK